jgi:hypothetical protein
MARGVGSPPIHREQAIPAPPGGGESLGGTRGEPGGVGWPVQNGGSARV